MTAGVIINRTQENAAGDNGPFVVSDTPLPSTAPEKKMVFVIVADREFGSKQEAAFSLSAHSCSHSIFLPWRDKNTWPDMNLSHLLFLKGPLPPLPSFIERVLAL